VSTNCRDTSSSFPPPTASRCSSWHVASTTRPPGCARTSNGCPADTLVTTEIYGSINFKQVHNIVSCRCASTGNAADTCPSCRRFNPGLGHLFGTLQISHFVDVTSLQLSTKCRGDTAHFASLPQRSARQAYMVVVGGSNPTLAHSFFLQSLQFVDICRFNTFSFYKCLQYVELPLRK